MEQVDFSNKESHCILYTVCYLYLYTDYCILISNASNMYVLAIGSSSSLFFKLC